MIHIQIELDEYDIKEAFRRARNETYQSWYRWDMTITLVSTACMCEELPYEDDIRRTTDKWMFSFQVVKN